MTTARIIEQRQSTEPTDRSMPPDMITTVMPSAMMATKVKLRVTLKRLFDVAKESVATERNRHAAITAMNTQKVCRPAIQLSQLCCFWPIWSSSVAAMEDALISGPAGPRAFS